MLAWPMVLDGSSLFYMAGMGGYSGFEARKPCVTFGTLKEHVCESGRFVATSIGGGRCRT